MTRSRGERVFNIFNVAILSLFCIMTLYPFLNLLAISLNNGLDSLRGGITIFPRKFTLENYRVAFSYPAMLDSALVSVFRTILGTFYQVSIVSMVAYSLSKKEILFRKILTIFLILPTFIQPGMVPVYVNISNLGLLNSFWVYILPAGFSFYHFVVLRTYMQSIDSSLEESALIEGAGYLRIFVTIIVPLALPAIAAVTIFTAVIHWNDWFSSMLYVTNKKLYTMQYVLHKILKENNSSQEVINHASFMENYESKRSITSQSIQMAILMITTLPIIVVYPIFQKYFVKGVMIGAVKG